MCRGVQESGFWQSPILIPSGGLVCCELCNSRASLYCLADDAFLCRKCDRWVHGANFLALRHARCLLCNTCQNLTQRYVVGIAVKVMLPTILSRVDRNRCESNAKSRMTKYVSYKWFKNHVNSKYSTFMATELAFKIICKTMVEIVFKIKLAAIKATLQNQI
ncbi:unnamed protein product [Malus baccata var. baccata]